MRIAGFVILLSTFFVGSLAFAQGPPPPVSLVELIANPQKFDGKLVAVRGYLVMASRRGGLSGTVLYLHKEDADNLLDTAVAVVPNEDMWRNEEQFDRMYVLLTGSFRVVPAGKGVYASTLRDVVRCVVWSDPTRPVGLKGEPQGQK